MLLELFFWISFFAPPVFIVLITLYVFRPSARQHYEDAKQVIFDEDKSLEPQRLSSEHDHSLRA